MDPYAALAPVYDRWQARYGAFHRLVLPRLEETWRRLGVAPASFFDLGCGTGSLLLELRRRHPGWRLAGLDGSAAMLAEARRKPAAETIEWVHGEFTAPVPERFDAGGAFFDALNHVSDAAALGAVFGAVARALVPGGLFVFDLNNRRGFEAWWRDRRAYRGDGWTLVMTADFDAGAGVGHGRAEVHFGGDTRITEVTERCFDDEQVQALLRAADLTPELCERWAPLPDDVPGKTWWAARR